MVKGPYCLSDLGLLRFFWGARSEAAPAAHELAHIYLADLTRRDRGGMLNVLIKTETFDSRTIPYRQDGQGAI